jgi:cytosine/creatinine deaminase
MDTFMQAAIAEAEQRWREGGIPIDSVLAHNGIILGRGHNQRVQHGSVIHHGEMNAIEKALSTC